MNKSLQQWIRLIIAATIIGLAVGLGIWLWQRRSLNSENSNASQNSNQSVNAANFNRANDQTAIDGEKDLLTDKLSETVINLRDGERGLALQNLREAAAIALSYEANQSESARRNQVFTNGIKQIQTSVEQNKIDEAAAAIDDLLDRLNMPAN